MLQFLRVTASEDQIEAIIGTWCMLVHDIDVQVSASIRRSWDQFVSSGPATPDRLALDDRFMPLLLTFVQRAVLDPVGTYADINPTQPISDVAPARKGAAKRQPVVQPRKDETRPNSEEEFETEQERKARLRIGAMGALRWMLSRSLALQGIASIALIFGLDTQPAVSGNSVDVMKMLLGNVFLWTALYHGERPPFVDDEGFGNQQPVVRKAAWSLLLTLLQSWKGMHQDEVIRTLLTSLLKVVWRPWHLLSASLYCVRPG